MLSDSKTLQELESREKDPEVPSQKTGLQCKHHRARPQIFAPSAGE